jgi:hypothetical protein
LGISDVQTRLAAATIHKLVDRKLHITKAQMSSMQKHIPSVVDYAQELHKVYNRGVALVHEAHLL